MTITVYGFGTYFRDSPSYHDIDILIVHSLTNHRACLDAISLKKIITLEIDKADVVILSRSAEAEFNFIEKSRAIFIHEITGMHCKIDYNVIFNTILNFRKTVKIS